MVLQGIPMDTLVLAKCPLAPLKKPSKTNKKNLELIKQSSKEQDLKKVLGV